MSGRLSGRMRHGVCDCYANGVAYHDHARDVNWSIDTCAHSHAHPDGNCLVRADTDSHGHIYADA